MQVSAILHITGDNFTAEKINQLIYLLENKLHFEILGDTTFDLNSTYLVIILTKEVSADNINLAFDGIKNQLQKTDGIPECTCKLLVTSGDKATGTFSINQ